MRPFRAPADCKVVPWQDVWLWKGDNTAGFVGHNPSGLFIQAVLPKIQPVKAKSNVSIN
jgi:hypothetical protein